MTPQWPPGSHHLVASGAFWTVGESTKIMFKEIFSRKTCWFLWSRWVQPKLKPVPEAAAAICFFLSTICVLSSYPRFRKFRHLNQKIHGLFRAIDCLMILHAFQSKSLIRGRYIGYPCCPNSPWNNTYVSVSQNESPNNPCSFSFQSPKNWAFQMKKSSFSLTAKLMLSSF